MIGKKNIFKNNVDFEQFTFYICQFQFCNKQTHDGMGGRGA
jgi:hypothetical protein